MHLFPKSARRPLNTTDLYEDDAGANEARLVGLEGKLIYLRRREVGAKRWGAPFPLLLEYFLCGNCGWRKKS